MQVEACTTTTTTTTTTPTTIVTPPPPGSSSIMEMTVFTQDDAPQHINREYATAVLTRDVVFVGRDDVAFILWTCITSRCNSERRAARVTCDV